MHHFNKSLTVVAVALGGLIAMPASAATQGLYLFEELVTVPIDAPYGKLLDSSGNSLDVVRQDPFGTFALTNDVAPPMLAGSSALDSVSGGAGNPITSDTNLFSIARTGELTVEFWYNPKFAGALNYIMQFGNDSANGWDIWQTATDGNITISAAIRDTANSLVIMNTGPSFTVESGWFHVAMTVDGAAAKLYIDGSEVASAAINPANIDEISTFLRLGSGLNGNFGGTFLMDDLRISDVALLPGAGTGIDELAWNATVVPEPASACLMLIGGALILSRRR